ncbi:unnamed protein product [Triticum turgidum subsp. durum]|uniref:Uncharacterized protein n=1 Tax=Triticum turgidum subsp. durum TaxID=4567 RepID=A0A9R1Q5L0_TRITD|nr:unnamed protein product [Triticum turgidum subsp. durum]
MQGAAAAAEGRSRASPDKADEESAKKPRLDLPDAHSVKQELVAPDAAEGGDPGGIVAAAAPYSPREELAVRIDKRLLHCPLCTLPFKPPVFQAEAMGLLLAAAVLNALNSNTVSKFSLIAGLCIHSKLRVPVSVPRLVLLGDDDNRVFLLTVGALGAGLTAVSVVCARASAATRPRFACKMWVNLEPAKCGKEDMVLVDMHMRSSSSPGAVVAAGEPTFLMVPPMYLVPAAGDGAASMEVPLHIRIDKLSPWSDALV